MIFRSTVIVVRVLSAIALLSVVGATRSATAVAISTIPVGNAGNFNDTNGYGQVFYNYRIGTYEVTNSQYTEFLNAKDPSGTNGLALYNSSMSTNPNGGIIFNAAAGNGAMYSVKAGRANQPVVYVSWFDGARFTNWLHNGQGNGNTEDGAYTLLGGGPTPTNQTLITRNTGATWFLPNETEWHKAAYHKNDGATGNYWDYPTGTNTPPISDQPAGAPGALGQANSANFYVNDDVTINGLNDGYAVTGTQVFNGLQNYLTDVGAYPLTKSPYGSFDMGGNVWEWTENQIAIISNSSYRSERGGSWTAPTSFPDDGRKWMVSSFTTSSYAGDEGSSSGFRVAAAVPEPQTLLLALLAACAMPFVSKRRCGS